MQQTQIFNVMSNLKSLVTKSCEGLSLTSKSEKSYGLKDFLACSTNQMLMTRGGYGSYGGSDPFWTDWYSGGGASQDTVYVLGSTNTVNGTESLGMGSNGMIGNSGNIGGNGNHPLNNTYNETGDRHPLTNIGQVLINGIWTALGGN